nr:MAG TPA: hypothetical protein [Caudoviricetes sp.]
MSGKNNATCSICGKPYELCRSCSSLNFKSWRAVTDDINCYKIYLILAEYNDTKDHITAKQRLEKCDLTELRSYPIHIKIVIQEIFKKSQTV